MTKKQFIKSLAGYFAALLLVLVAANVAYAGEYKSGTSFKLTSDGGLAVWMTNAELRGQDPAQNSTNATIPAGSICVFNATLAGGVQLAGNNSMTASTPFLVATESTYPGSGSWYVHSGVADVSLPMGMGADKGDGIWVSYFSGGLSWQYLGRCNATEAFNATSIGILLETATGTAGSNSTKAKALLVPQRIPS